jgi:hypothetical protein
MNARDKKTFDFIEKEMEWFAGIYGLKFKGLLTIYREKHAKSLYGFCNPDGRIAIRIRAIVETTRPPPKGRPLC